MKYEFIYLDWNIVKALKENRVNEKISVAINILKTKYFIPFSFAHLCDRQKNMSEANIELIKSDLDFFNGLSDGYMRGRYEDDYDIAKQNIFKNMMK